MITSAKENTHEKILLSFLSLAMLLVSCSINEDVAYTTNESSESSDAYETVDNIFDTTQNSSELESDGIMFTHGLDNERIDDDVRYYIVYDGGEMVLQYHLTTANMPDFELALLLYLDGEPQPYRVEGGDGSGNEDYSYMHILYPEDGAEEYYNIIFTPTKGNEGDVLEVYYSALPYPNYFPPQDIGSVGDLTYGCLTSCVRVCFEADPPTSPEVDVIDRVISYSLTQEDLTADDLKNWTEAQLQTDLGYYFYYNDHDCNKNVYEFNFTADNTITARLELFGTPYVDYAVTFYIDNVPILIDGDAIYISSLDEGKKTVIEIELDMSDFDRSSVLYGMVIPRNYYEARANDLVSSDAAVQELNSIYISSASSFSELKEQYNT